MPLTMTAVRSVRRGQPPNDHAGLIHLRSDEPQTRACAPTAGPWTWLGTVLVPAGGPVSGARTGSASTCRSGLDLYRQGRLCLDDFVAAVS
jgi:hypothetical protein